MKFKLKATARDWVIFAVFAILLLYIVCIGVLNLHSFSVSGAFYGLNPFPAFLPEFIGATLLFYILLVVFVFISVSSYFFDKESGFGFKVGDKDTKDGYENWCNDKKMKESLKEINLSDKDYSAAGIPLVNNGRKVWVDDGESHNLVIGTTGSGKTQCIIHPLVKILAKAGESMVVTDPKGEIYQENASLLKQKGYRIIVLNFRDPQRGNCWNPLDLPYRLYKGGNVDKGMELLDDLGANILHEENAGNADPFWQNTAADYFIGLTLGLFEDATPSQVNLNSISLMATQADEKCGPRSTYGKEYLNSKDQTSSLYASASGTVFAPEDTKGSIVTTFKQKIRLFASRVNLSEMLSHSDFDMGDIGRHKTAVFMIIQDEKKTYHALATIFIKQCYESLIDVAQNTPGGALPVRTNFLLDEFANMPPLKDVTTMITAARSRHVRFTMIIQNFAQLDQVYGKENAQTIRSNCNNMVYLLTTELAALKEISELCGERKVKIKGSGGKDKESRDETRPLVSVADLQKMKQFEVIIKRVRLSPYRTKLAPNFSIDWGIPKQNADAFITRPTQAVDMFNLKEYVDNKKKDSFLDNDNMGVNNLFSNNNPFSQLRPSFNNINNNAITSTTNSINNSSNLNQNSDLYRNSIFDNKQVDSKIDSDFDVDDLVRKIDAKIAELEAEEKAQEEAEKISKPNGSVLTNITPTMDVTNENVTDIYNNSNHVKITDDQFFDDFFDE